MTKIPVHIAEKLLLMSQGENIAASSAKHVVIDELVDEKIVTRTGRIHKTMSVRDKKALSVYLQNKFSISDLEKYIDALKREDITRSESIEISGNSKLKTVRTFKGFLVNCYSPIQAQINENTTVINPTEGVFQFIYDFERFEIPHDITVVGIENPENFRYIEKQKYLFENITSLFVSRYPQNQSKDLLKWLQSVPNKYLHFGDFDFAGIGIYLNEYRKYLGDKSAFVVPENIEDLIAEYGNKSLYDKQRLNFDTKTITEKSLRDLISLIHKYKCGLEQEILIKR
jgi:hypothetical protein